MKNYYLLYILLLSFSVNSFGQDSLPKFGSPLDIPLFLSGNFAELRSNHFHTGIDIKTLGVEGQNVLAAESGVISRIAVSPWGYGNALYIDHPNGYTTVYAHMQSFSEEITAVLREEQYSKESFQVDFNPTSPIRVDRGQFIGLSGNSGGSGGAHLHFEIRKTSNQRPQNPLLFGFDIKDDIQPRIRGLRVHPLSDYSFVNGQQDPKSFVISGSNGKYQLKSGTKIEVYGPFGLSLHTNDYLNGQPNKCGIYSLDLDIDNRDICFQAFNELDFSTSRHINSYKDYEAYHMHGWHYHKSFKDPGNLLEIYQHIEHDGVIDIETPGVHKAQYRATDAYGNSSVLDFNFYTLSEMPSEPAVEPYDAYFTFNMDNSFEYENELHVSIPEGALYKDLKFQFGRELPDNKSLSAYYTLQGTHTPLQKPISIHIVFDSTKVANPKQIIAVRESPTGSKSYLTGDFIQNGYTLSSKSFGKFYLALDTVAPQLSAFKWSTGGQVSSKTELRYRSSDDKTGLASYKAILNGKWTLLEYDPKNTTLRLRVGESEFQKGANEVVIIVEDACGNRNEQKFTYTF